MTALCPKPTLAALIFAVAIVAQSMGCSHLPKGRWYDPKMVPPCPSANPKAYESCFRFMQPVSYQAESDLSVFRLCSYEEEIPIGPRTPSPSADSDVTAEEVELAPATSTSRPSRSGPSQPTSIELPQVEDPDTEEVVVGRQASPPTSIPNAVSGGGGETIETPRRIGETIISDKVVGEAPEPGEVIWSDEGASGMIQHSQPAGVLLSSAETYYAMAVDADKQMDEAAINMFLEAAMASYRFLEAIGPERNTSKDTARAWQIYHSSVARMIYIADRVGWIDKATGIKLPAGNGYRIVEFEYINFQRTADDFDAWQVVGDYQSDYLLTKHRQPGLGVPLVVVRKRRQGDRWHPPETPFSATAILRPEGEMSLFEATREADTPDDTYVEQVVARLELYDPRVSGDVEFRCAQVPLAKDTTAPYAYYLSQVRGSSRLKALHPTKDYENTGLFILEPHRRGKIPVIFVHGLLSEPYTWAGMANEIDGNADLAARYEVWGFHYPTGAPLLESAAVLREQLDQIIREMDPSGFDRDLRNVILVGHSMGGLIAKLQVTDSRNTLWEHVAYQPISTLQTTPQMKDYLRRQFIFQRSPHVGRVVFVGTPHQGSAHACATLGKATSHLIHQDACLKEAHHQLVHDNPAAFRKELRRRIPTSLDLVHPDSLLLKGIYRLPIAPDVPAHSIVGSGWWSIHDGRSDGVVPVSSARLPGVQTEIMVNAKHKELTHEAGVTCEILRILRVHGTRPAFAGGSSAPGASQAGPR